eukprot:TRINITY_DN4077_c0_g1_i2.p1 TRINITY_DN4077_c0_g1~~TRINITY_DN4077_c0_g1_i2.p1  ORF type:complete len:673 (+),score=141.72 TRINITY_DN4077_c0_g1_i2:209-2020(+)
MPLRLDIKKLLSARSERVKCVDIHPTEPWVLAALYDGHVFIYDYTTQQVVKSWEVSEQPIRCGAFIPRQQWVIVGADDMFIRVYNYNTMDKVATFEAHQDYIRSVAMHPTLPLVVSCSDDMLIKIWDWEKGWSCMQVLEGHSHYIMQVKFNPKDPNTFATASLDHTVKVWSLSSPVPNYTLEGHEKGVNSVDYYSGGDKPYLVTGSDDKSVKIWDYQTKSCVTTLTGHNHNVSAVAFLPDRPLIVSGSEDGSVLLWHANTYRLETTLNYGLDRCWSVAYLKGSNLVALGFDNGSVLLQLGKDEPVASMDHGGKVILAKHNEISTVNVRNANSDSLRDGERVVLPSKELGSCEIYPQSVAHSPNGRFVAVCGDGEYIIYTALAWRNKAFGTADEVVWDGGAGEYAVRIGPSDVRVYNKAFQERTALRVPFQTDAIFGGALLGVRGPDFVCFLRLGDTGAGAPHRRHHPLRVLVGQRGPSRGGLPGGPLCAVVRPRRRGRGVGRVGRHARRGWCGGCLRAAAPGTRHGSLGSLGGRLFCLHQWQRAPQLHCRRGGGDALPPRPPAVSPGLPAEGGPPVPGRQGRGCGQFRATARRARVQDRHCAG